jgi:hypothetical protein
MAGIGAAPRQTILAQTPKPGQADLPARELAQAEARVEAVTSRPLLTARSALFQAIGDASESFIKTTLSDCEFIALDFLDHYRAKGFDVKRPAHRLTLVVFFDERPFIKFVPGVPEFVSGFYKRTENWLVLFDFRNVPVRERRAGYTNMMTLAHETTHLLSYNTGLLNRQGDAPRAIVEGLAMYGETRRLHGRSEPGQIDSMRLDDLAHVQRRTNWKSVAELLADERAAFGPTLDHTILAYAQSWLLVYYLMTSPSRLPQFRAYVKAIYPRTDDRHRIEDAEKYLGNLDQLDREVRREAVRLQQAR